VSPDVEIADRPEDAEGPVTAVRRLDAEARRAESPCGDGRMVWRSWGDGPALVLLHGGAGSWQHWVRTVPAFSRTHRVLAPDLPGLGESADPPAPPDMTTISAIVAAGSTGCSARGRPTTSSASPSAPRWAGTSPSCTASACAP
jgi:alpha/beta hydrolase fold